MQNLLNSQTLLLVIVNPRLNMGNYGQFIGLYENFQAYVDDMDRHHTVEHLTEVLDIKESDITDKDWAYYMDLQEHYIILVPTLDKNKPIYVGLTGNHYYKWISNDKKGQDIVGVIKEYKFNLKE